MSAVKGTLQYYKEALEERCVLAGVGEQEGRNRSGNFMKKVIFIIGFAGWVRGECTGNDHLFSLTRVNVWVGITENGSGTNKLGKLKANVLYTAADSTRNLSDGFAMTCYSLVKLSSRIRTKETS